MHTLSKKGFILTYNSIAISIILILHIVGLIQITLFEKVELMRLSHVIILISSVLCLIPEFRKSKNIVLPYFSVFMIGLLAEMIGVNTGWLFGDYIYSDSLGLKIFNTPVIIGLLWLSLSIGIQSILKNTVLKKWSIIFIGALAMTGFDILLEPVAIHFNLWTWSSENVPIYNYVCWFVFAFLMQIILFRTTDSKSLFRFLFVVNILFFTGLILSI